METLMKKAAQWIVAVSLVSGMALAQMAFDSAANYGSWTDGSNGGVGFGAWSIVSDGGSGGFAGAFLGDPSQAGITNMSDPSFGLFANPSDSGATVTVRRSMPALQVGWFFEVDWGLHWDSDTGNKGLNLFSGGTELININQGGFPGDITINGDNTNIAFGTDPMTWRFTHVTPGNVLVEATGRTSGTGIVFSQTFAVSGLPDEFSFYASNMGSGDQRQPYFNNLQVVPEPGTAVLLVGGLGMLAWLRHRRKGNHG